MTSLIVEKLIKALENNNGFHPGEVLNRLIPVKREELENQLIAGVAMMAAAGCRFTEDDIDLMATGDQDEAQERFAGFNGYTEATEALNNLFDPEQNWVDENWYSKRNRYKGQS
jgi:hypothetical protein